MRHRTHAAEWEAALCLRSLLKFRENGGQQTYDLYRDAAAGVVRRQGGGLAYAGAAVVRSRRPARWSCIES